MRTFLPSDPTDPHAIAALRIGLGRTVMTRPHSVLPFGDARIDGCLAGGGLALGQLHEVASSGIEAETGTVTAAFIACLLARLAPGKPIFWITNGESGCELYPPGLLAYGLDPGRVVEARTPDAASTLAAMETALRSGAAAAVVGEIGRLDRTPSRRLQLACLHAGTTGFALHRWPYGQKGPQQQPETVAITRWHVTPAPSKAEHGEPGRPRWNVRLLHARGGQSGSWVMQSEEAKDGTYALRVVAELANAAFATQPRSRTVVSAGHR